MFDKGHWISIKSLNEDNLPLMISFSLNRNLRENIKRHKFIANSGAPLNDAYVHSDADDIVDKRTPTQAKLQ